MAQLPHTWRRKLSRLKTSGWTEAEDARPAKSAHRSHWVGDEYTWKMEVRDTLPSASWRMGEMTLRGNFDGELRMSITTMEKV